MKILVCPHDLDLGGSQLNAIELAAAVTAIGHECIVFGRRGTLCARIDELGLEFVESPEPGRRPSQNVARAIRELVVERGIDVVHGYEWPPALEAALATEPLPDAAAVCTVMSMAVAPFLPKWMPLVVGTQQISAVEQARGRLAVTLIEPPVDLAHNTAPGDAEIAAFRARWGLDERPVVACVSRLVPDLKAEGILAAIEVAGELADALPFQLLIVGDGSSRPDMVKAAARADAGRGRRSVVFTGELADPRVAYATADIMLGMGGSALRSLAFGKPLIVQGEHGFFRTLSRQTAEVFRWQGWYGVGEGRADGAGRLRAELEPLLADEDLRRELGAFSRELVEDFSITKAAHRQVAVYRDAWAARADQKRRFLSAAASAGALGGYYLRRGVARRLGRAPTDDFNAVPVAGERHVTAGAPRAAGAAHDPILYFPGVAWDDVAGTDRQLVTEISRQRPVIWVDPTQSPLRRRVPSVPAVTSPRPNIVRLRGAIVPANQRPVLRWIADVWCGVIAQAYLRRNGLTPSAVVCASSSPMLAHTRRLPGRKVYYATDDFVEAGALWGVDRRYLGTAREANLREADLVLAVTPELARHLQRTSRASRWLPNGADLDVLARPDVERAQDVRLPSPIAGVVGQFNSRVDLSVLQAVQGTGIGLLLVGPQRFHSSDTAERFAALTRLPGVQWVTAVPRDDLPAYLACMDVGLTPYADTMFNRRSYPLKTIEYLAAGRPVVATDVATTEGLDARFVSTAGSAEAFASLVHERVRARSDDREIRRSVADAGWPSRARQLLAWLDEEGTAP
ncbi:glycosyltransferase family 4 protein [Microbacterium sp. NPDC058389]|uniref:glycosyltransferase family 4 protein n=1 Tax=Microbacterium sp. NPDC058389 TaxID=3346475 RepID=UPI003652E7F5